MYHNTWKQNCYWSIIPSWLMVILLLVYNIWSHSCLEIYNQVNSVKTDITATEAITHIVLDKQRNNLILFDLKANLASVSIASGTFVTSIFGMNLMSQLEQIPGLFYIACGSTAIITALVYRATMKLLAMIRPGRLTTAEEIQKLFKR